MRPIVWIVSLINRRSWDKKFAEMVAEVESAPKSETKIPHIEEMMEIAKNQPTHLAHNFMSRARRNHHNKKKGGVR